MGRPLHSSRQRLTMDRTKAVGTSFFTDDQRAFRNNIGAGRWQSDAEVGAHAPIFGVRHHGGHAGACDLVPLEADESAWLELPGVGARDFAVTRPC